MCAAISDVCFGSEADIRSAKPHVRFASESDRNSGHRRGRWRAEHFSLCPIRLNVNLFGYCESIIHIDAEIPHSALYLGVTEQ